MNTDTVTQTAGQGAADFLTVLFAWMFTPTGAVLTLLLLAVGGGSVFMKIMGRSMRMLSVAARICAGLFFVWVISGVLEAMGIPIREWMQGIASQLSQSTGKQHNAGMIRQKKLFRIHLPNHSRIPTVLCENFRMP